LVVQDLTPTFQSDDLARRVHDGRVGRDGTTNRIRRIPKVDDDDLSRFTDLLTHADELIRLHGERAETDVCRVDADIL